MEGIENGYDDLPPAFPRKRVYALDSEPGAKSTRQGDHDNHHRDQVHEQRRAEKRRRKEEKAARKAKRAKRKLQAREHVGARAGARAEVSRPEKVETEAAVVVEGKDELNLGGKEATRKKEKARKKELKAKRRLEASNAKEKADEVQDDGEGELSLVDDRVRRSPDDTKKISTPLRLNGAQGESSSSSSRATPNPSHFRAKKSRTSTSSTKGKDKETDDELKAKFKAPGAMNAWLASQWHDLKELQRLEGLGILAYKRGRFTEEEKAAINTHLSVFKMVNRMDDDELLGIIMGKGRFSERKDFPKFWPEVAANAPGRPVKAVKDFVKREFDPRGNKGAWTKEEDGDLLRAYQVHPNEWTKIANIVGRTEMDCRDRYRKELAFLDTRKTGHWDLDEERQLVHIVKEANEESGSEPLSYEAPWEVVVLKMGGTRSLTQCRKKWQEQLRMAEMTRTNLPRLKTADRSLLVQKLIRLDPQAEAEIEWTKLCKGVWNGFSPSSLRGLFWRMKNEVEGQERMSLEDLLEELERRYPVSNMSAESMPRTGTPRSRMVMRPEIESEEEM